MPTILRKSGFNFKINTADHEPMHVHVWYQGGEILIYLGDENNLPSIRENLGVKLSKNDALCGLRLRMPHICAKDGEKFMAKIKLGKFEVEEAELDRQHEEATKRGQEIFERAAKAASAKYDSQTKRLIIELKNDVIFMIPTDLIQGLRGASAADIDEIELWMEGVYLHWEKLDVDFEVSSLINGVFGTPKWMGELNSKSEAGSKPRKKVA